MESFEDKLSRVLAERIEVVDYSPTWPTLFETERARLAAYFLQGSIRRIEHIGSTAVPGLAAKPIIDILVGVDDFGFVVDSVAPAMEEAGYDYFFRPELGDEGPRYPWFIGRNPSGVRVSHIHVALIDDASQWDRVVFRDYLRSHADAAVEYAKLKRDLAARHSGDRETYTLAKTSFITEAVALARAEGIAGASSRRHKRHATKRGAKPRLKLGHVGLSNVEGGMAQSPGYRVELSAFLPEHHGDLLGSWLRQPHVSKWWGDPDKTLLEVSKPPNAGGEALITVDGSPVGYLRWQVPDRAELDAAGLHEVSLDAVDIDIAVGETAWLGRGVGPRALMLLVDRLVEDGASTIMLATSAENPRAVRAYEKAGFTRRRQFVDTDGSTYWLMTIEARPG